jgi:hypothetical protein
MAVLGVFGALVLLLLLEFSAADDLSLKLLTSLDKLAAEFSPFELVLLEFLLGSLWFFKAPLAIGLKPVPLLLFPWVVLIPE